MPDDLPDLIHAIGQALYGDNYKGQLAQDLNVRKDTLRAWANGRSVPPDNLRDDLDQLVIAQIQLLAEIRARLKT